MLRLARAFDRSGDHPDELAFARLATAIAKYWICRRAPGAIADALECLGGNGYVEESILPRLYREAPVNAIWEGSGNVLCLDVLRAMERAPRPWPRCWPSWRGPAARIAALMPGWWRRKPSLPIGPGSSTAPDRWWSGWRWHSRQRS